MKQKRLDLALRKKNVLLGVVHLAPLPGSPRHRGADIETISQRARTDAERLLEAGFDGYLVENFGDAPFFKGSVPPHVLTVMTRIILALPRKDALVGANVLRNDAAGALALATACRLDMIRVNVHAGAMVTDQGLVEGDAAATVRTRETLAPETAILADVAVKHAVPAGQSFDLADAARETAYRGLADALIVTGNATGSPTSMADVDGVRKAVPDRALLVGSGVTKQTIREVLQHADGVIVGTGVKSDGQVDNPVDSQEARRLVEEVRK